MSDLRILAIGDIVGRPGRDLVKERMRPFMAEHQVDLCIANGENSAGGAGITPEIVEELVQAGVGMITTGDHIWDKKEIVPYLDKSRWVLRPANYVDVAAGRGYGIVTLASGQKVGVLNLQGRVFMAPSECPFKAADEAIEILRRETPVIVVDFHAEATSEKIALGWHLDGRVSFLYGTHTHVQTADETVLPKGTAYLTDLGMSGPHESVLGRRIDRVLHLFTTNMPAPFDVATGDVRLMGAIATIDPLTGRAKAIERVAIRPTVPSPAPERPGTPAAAR